MPGANLSFDILSAGASAKAGDWAEAEAGASLDVDLAAEVSRGVKLAAGAEALVQVDASVTKFIAAGVGGEASASARVAAQVQVPLDLFDECGLAVRLQAVAEAAAGVELRIGLSAGDFLRLAGQDNRMKGVPLRLLSIMLEEMVVQGGVQAKAAVAAMAYANVTLTGRLIPVNGQEPGFSIVAGAGVGLAAGAGFKVFAEFGVRDPRRLVRRTIDVAVDATYDAIAENAPAATMALLDEARMPAKLALRTAFELGLALAENGGAFNAQQAEQMALRCVQVALEEAQRFILERAVRMAFDGLLTQLRSLGFDNAKWTAAAPERNALKKLLKDDAPAEPFALDSTTLTYWMDVLAAVAALANKLGSGGAQRAEVDRSCAVIWSAAQLLFASVERISETNARASVIGVPPAVATAAFAGPLDPAPAAIKGVINAALGRGANQAVRKEHLVQYLTRTAVLDGLADHCPAVARVARLVTGSAATSFGDALRTIFENIGSLVPDASGQLNARATLEMVRSNLAAFMNDRMADAVRPAMEPLTNGRPELRTYVDEVLISTMRYATDRVLGAVVDWANGDTTGQKALRETCSAILMRLFGRSLVVSGDVLMAHALKELSGAFTYVAHHVDDNDGLAKAMSDVTGLPRAEMAEVMEQTMLIMADTFKPMNDGRRARMRSLLYQVMDTAPADPGAGLLEELRDDAMVPNLEAATDLAFLLGEEIAERLSRFVQASMVRLLEWVLEEILQLVEAFVRMVQAWIEALRQLVQVAARRLLELVEAIAQGVLALEQATDDVLRRASDLLNIFADGNRTKVKTAIKDHVKRKARAALYDFIPFFADFPSDTKKWFRDRTNEAVDLLFDNAIFDLILDVCRALADDVADFMDDLRAIEPGDDLASTILDIFLDRFEAAVRDAFGSSPRISFAVGGHELASVPIPLDGLCDALRQGARQVDALQNMAEALAADLYKMIQVAAGVQADEAEQRLLHERVDRTNRKLATADAVGLDLSILSPLTGAICEGRAVLEVFIHRAPEDLLGRTAFGALMNLTEPRDAERFAIWLNHEEVALDRAEVEYFAPTLPVLTPLRDPSMPGAKLIHPIADMRDLPLRLGYDTAHRNARAVELRHDASVRDARKGRAVATVTGKGKAVITGDPRPVRPMRRPERAEVTAHPEGGLLVRLELPVALLVDGLNALAIALVPGGSARTIQKAVSFLFVPCRNKKPGTPIMPGRMGWDNNSMDAKVAAAIQQQLGRKGMGAMGPLVTAKAGEKRRLHTPTKAERRAALDRSTKALAQRADAPVMEVRSITQAIRSKVYRPRPLATAVIKRRPEPPLPKPKPRKRPPAWPAATNITDKKQPKP